MLNSCSCLLSLCCSLSLCRLSVTATVITSGCDWEKWLFFRATEGDHEVPDRHSVHLLTRQCHRVATRRKHSQRKRLLTISEQYQIDILAKKESRFCFGGSLVTCLYKVNHNSMRQNISLSMSTYNTHYLLYIHIHIKWTMYCFVLYITHYKSYYWNFQWPLHCTVYRCHTKCNVTPLV